MFIVGLGTVVPSQRYAQRDSWDVYADRIEGIG